MGLMLLTIRLAGGDPPLHRQYPTQGPRLAPYEVSATDLGVGHRLRKWLRELDTENVSDLAEHSETGSCQETSSHHPCVASAKDRHGSENSTNKRRPLGWRRLKVSIAYIKSVRLRKAVVKPERGADLLAFGRVTFGRVNWLP